MKAMHRVRYWGQGGGVPELCPQPECVNPENSLALSTRNFYGGSIQVWLIESSVIRSVSSPSPLPTDGLKVALSCQVVSLGPSPTLKLSHESAPQHAQRTPTTQKSDVFRTLCQEHEAKTQVHIILSYLGTSADVSPVHYSSVDTAFPYHERPSAESQDVNTHQVPTFVISGACLRAAMDLSNNRGQKTKIGHVDITLWMDSFMGTASITYSQYVWHLINNTCVICICWKSNVDLWKNSHQSSHSKILAYLTLSPRIQGPNNSPAKQPKLK